MWWFSQIMSFVPFEVHMTRRYDTLHAGFLTVKLSSLEDIPFEVTETPFFFESLTPTVE